MKKLFFALLCVAMSLAGCKKSDDGVYSDKFTGTRWSGVCEVSAVEYEFAFHSGNECTYTETPPEGSQPGDVIVVDAKYRYNETYEYVSINDEESGDVIGIAYIRDEAKMFMNFVDDTREDVVLLKR